MTLAILWPATGHAQDGSKSVDLELDAIPITAPTSLLMRAAGDASAAAVPTVMPGPAIRVPASAGAVAVAATATDAELTSGTRTIPTSLRDLEEQIIFRANIGYGLDSGGLSGDPLKTGVDPSQVTDPDGNAFAENRQYLLGDATLGTRGILMPSMHTYFLSQFALDFDGASRFAAINNAIDRRNARALLVRSGYVEFDGFGDKSTPLGKVFLRGGRQFRYGSAAFITNFDGVSAGYDDDGFEVSGFFGRRVSLYFNDDPGLLGGAGVVLRGKKLFNVPVDVTVDYLFFDGGGPADGTLVDPNISLSRQYVELAARTEAFGAKFYVRGRLVDNGEYRVGDQIESDGLGLGRLSLRIRKPIGRKLLIVADVEQLFDREVSYDYIGAHSSDVVDIAERIGIGLDGPQNATRLGVRVNATRRGYELYGFGRAHLSSEQAASSYNATWFEGGVAGSLSRRRKIHLTGQYKVRATQLDDDANGPGSEFFNTAGTGVSSFHEFSGEARYSLGYRKATAAVGAYGRIYNLQSPYATAEQDFRAGARFDANYWFHRNLRVKGAGEIAQPSPTLAPELGLLMSIRLLLEASF